MISVTAKCIGCGTTLEIKPFETPLGEHPICKRCGMPIIAVKARHTNLWRDSAPQRWLNDHPESAADGIVIAGGLIFALTVLAIEWVASCVTC